MFEGLSLAELYERSRNADPSTRDAINAEIQRRYPRTGSTLWDPTAGRTARMDFEKRMYDPSHFLGRSGDLADYIPTGSQPDVPEPPAPAPRPEGQATGTPGAPPAPEEPNIVGALKALNPDISFGPLSLSKYTSSFTGPGTPSTFTPPNIAAPSVEEKVPAAATKYPESAVPGIEEGRVKGPEVGEAKLDALRAMTKVDPWQGVLRAGLGMLAAGPGKSFAQAVGEGGQSGLENILAQKRQAAEAEQKIANIEARQREEQRSNLRLGMEDVRTQVEKARSLDEMAKGRSDASLRVADWHRQGKFKEADIYLKLKELEQTGGIAAAQIANQGMDFVLRGNIAGAEDRFRAAQLGQVASIAEANYGLQTEQLKQLMAQKPSVAKMLQTYKELHPRATGEELADAMMQHIAPSIYATRTRANTTELGQAEEAYKAAAKSYSDKYKSPIEVQIAMSDPTTRAEYLREKAALDAAAARRDAVRQKLSSVRPSGEASAAPADPLGIR